MSGRFTSSHRNHPLTAHPHAASGISTPPSSSSGPPMSSPKSTSSASSLQQAGSGQPSQPQRPNSSLPQQ
jgi:hypothetical protein